MSKPSKRKQGKVPKITEEEYVAYLTALKNEPPSRETAATIQKPNIDKGINTIE